VCVCVYVCVCMCVCVYVCVCVCMCVCDARVAQGIFTNFRRLLDFNGGRLPLTAAQVRPCAPHSKPKPPLPYRSPYHSPYCSPNG
jgi:hypothetical protein